MAEERIDIAVTQKGSREVKRDIENIGDGAKVAETQVELLNKALADMNSRAKLTSGATSTLKQAMTDLGIGTAAQNLNIKQLGPAYDIATKRITGLYTATGVLRTALRANDPALQRAIQGTNGLSAASQNLNTNSGRVRSSVASAGNAIKQAGNQAATSVLSFRNLFHAFVALSIIHQVIGSITSSIDEWILVSNRLRQVTSDTLSLRQAQDDVYASAQRSRSGLEDFTTLYTRTSMATKNLKLSQKELLDITETVAMAMKLNGGSVMETAQSMRQLSQAFNKGKLDGDEFRTIMEAAPQLQKVFTEALGVSTAELYKMSAAGELTLPKLIDAIQKAGPAIHESFGRTLPSITEGLLYAGNAFTQFIGHLNEATGFSAGFYNIMKVIGDNMDIVAAALGVLGVALIAAFGPGIVTMLYAFATAIVVSLGPIGLVVTGIAAVTAGILIWSGRTGDASRSTAAHLVLVEQVKQAYIDSQGAVKNWADTIEGATRSQILVALQEADKKLSDMRLNLLSSLSTNQMLDLTIGALSNTKGPEAQIVDLSNTFRAGGIDVSLYKAKLEELKAAYPKIPTELIVSLENYADKTKDAEIASDKLHAAWVLMGENVPDIVKKAAEQILGIKSIFDELTNISNLSGVSGKNPEELARDNASAQEMLATKQQELAVTIAITRYGEDSIQVANLRMAAEANVVERQLAGLNISQELHDQIMNTVKIQSLFNNGPMSASLQGAVNWTAALIDKLRVAIGLKAVFGNTSDPTITPIVQNIPGGLDAIARGEMQYSGGKFHRPVTVPKTYTPSGTGTGISGNVGAQANLQEINTFAQVQEAMEKEYKALILTNDQRAIQEAVIEKTNQLRQAGVELSPLEIAQLTSATEKMQALTEQTALFGSSIDRVMQGASDAISQFVATGRVDFKSLVSSMIQDIARLATQQYILKPISNILNTFVGGLLGGAAPTLFPTVAPSPHFATGGGFTVGGTGGVDSQLIQMRASPGERVRVSRAGQEGNSGSGATIIFNISTPDVAGFKATQSQIAARMSRLVNHGSRNS